MLWKGDILPLAYLWNRGVEHWSREAQHRTEYWKSQDRKYCDFCKCWITDNKPSVQFHENGKRHKENVAKKISELSKKSAKAYKESQKVDEEMKKMEEAALKAYMHDIEANPDFTSQQFKKSQEEKAANQQEELKDIVKNVVQKAKEVRPPKSAPVKSISKKKIWYEAKTEQGLTYYWNTETQASVWEPPEEGFVGLEEQKKEAEAAARLKEVEKNVAAGLQEMKEKEGMEEARAYAAREQMKKYRKEEAIETPSEPPGPIIGPTPKIDPYGGWTAVQKVVPPQIDWQLPQTPRFEVPQVVIKEPQIKIKEKKVTSLDDHDSNSAPVFKKRKPNPGRGNLRQRFDDE